MKPNPASRRGQILASLVCGLTLWTTSSPADQVKVAVAANFTAAMKEIAKGFEQSTGHRALISFGSTGKLYAQIANGAPFGVFLAADQARPERLEQAGKASRRFTYATGKLVLWSVDRDTVDPAGKVLGAGDFKHLAIANPKTAPYGSAAMRVLNTLELDIELGPKLVRGDSIAQTYQFVATASAQLGFVALAQVVLAPEGSRWVVPQSLYQPIRQDAVLLQKGENEAAALALLDYLTGEEAKEVISRFGYGVE